MQIRGLQAQLADARQEQKEQAADKAALQTRLEAANEKATAQDADKSKYASRPATAQACLQQTDLLLLAAMSGLDQSCVIALALQ